MRAWRGSRRTFGYVCQIQASTFQRRRSQTESSIFPLTREQDIELDDWDTVMNVNLRASFLLAKGCVRGVGEGEMGQSILNLLLIVLSLRNADLQRRLIGRNSFKKALRGMKEKGWGRLIFVSSIAGYGAGVNGPRTF
jgi:NAD(P)-dependent dehydrogenase (short-subunit alcohol dehydrogenase family)